jgi:hypothetical protein
MCDHTQRPHIWKQAIRSKISAKNTCKWEPSTYGNSAAEGERRMNYVLSTRSATLWQNRTYGKESFKCKALIWSSWRVGSPSLRCRRRYSRSHFRQRSSTAVRAAPSHISARALPAFRVRQTPVSSIIGAAELFSWRDMRPQNSVVAAEASFACQKQHPIMTHEQTNQLSAAA